MRISLRFDTFSDAIKAARDNVPSTLLGEDSADAMLAAFDERLRAIELANSDRNERLAAELQSLIITSKQGETDGIGCG
jgi:hypothetical protein